MHVTEDAKGVASRDPRVYDAEQETGQIADRFGARGCASVNGPGGCFVSSVATVVHPLGNSVL